MQMLLNKFMYEAVQLMSLLALKKLENDEASICVLRSCRIAMQLQMHLANAHTTLL